MVLSKNLDRIDKIHIYLSFVIFALLVVAIVVSIVTANWVGLFASALALILSLAPTLFEWRTKIDIPEEFEFAIIAFIFASILLGEQGFYQLFWWWDVVLHAGFSVAIALFGFAILFILHKNGKLQAKPFTVAVFTFAFALALGALWEIFEFAMDSFFGLNMQKSGLVDTMWDLIVDAGGALLVAILGFFYLKGKKTQFIDRLARRLIAKNPHLFKKKRRK